MSEWVVSWFTRWEWIALGWTLLHFCWQGAAIGLIFAAADRITHRAAPAARYLVALGAFALIPLSVAVTFAGELRSLAPADPSAHASMSWQEANGRGARATLGPTIPHAFSSIAAVRNAWPASHVEQILPWVDTVWMLGLLILAVRALGGWWQLEQLRRRARRAVPAALQNCFKLLCERIHVGRHVVLRISDELISPLAMGVWRATVLLPVSAVMHLAPEELEAVLAHELGHIRRWDYLCNLMQTAVECMLFFHPAVWWISATVRDRREICCDEIAVRSCPDAVVYARALLRLEEQRTAELQLAMALKGCSGSLLGRVKRVLGEDGPMESRMVSGVRVAVASAVALALLLGPKVSDAIAAPRPMADRVVAMVAGAPSPRTADTVQMANEKPATTPSGDVLLSPAPETASIAPGAIDPAPAPMMQAAATTNSKSVSYIDGMRAAGYPLDLNNDLNTLISLKSLGVTPEYAKQMGTLGYGKPTVQELISLKSLGVTPEYLSAMKDSGLGPKDFHEAVTEKALGITPEYAAAMKKTGFTDGSLQELISIKAQGVTPEYVSWFKQQFPQATMAELQRAAVFHLDDKFIAAAKSHGFDGKDLDKLLRLKISGLLDE